MAASRPKSHRVTVSGRKGDVLIADDEQPGKANADKIPQPKPAFRKDGTVTAANPARFPTVPPLCC